MHKLWRELLVSPCGTILPGRYGHGQVCSALVLQTTTCSAIVSALDLNAEDSAFDLGVPKQLLNSSQVSSGGTPAWLRFVGASAF